MMPVATPPNTIAYASGHLKISDMIKAGIWLNIISLIIIGVIIALILGPVFDVELNKIQPFVYLIHKFYFYIGIY